MINTKKLRCTIGVLGMLLPIIVAVLSVSFGYRFPDSISETYYHSPCTAPFLIILGSASILLFNYNGYDKVDDIVNTLASVFALGVCLFPIAASPEPYVGTFNLPIATSNILHYVSAIGFFLLLAYNSLFQFTKGSATPTENKKKRNIIFIVCGVGMILSFLLLPFASFGFITIPHVTFWIETVALIFFGVSWLTKANCIPFLFADPKK